VTTEERLAPKPAGVTFEQAATLNVAGLTALQGLRDRARVRAGQRVLVNGAGGGVGTFAVRVAKWLGAHVTAVTRAGSADVVRSLGADEVIDHDAEDFTGRRARWDVIFDVGGTRPFGRCRRVLEPDGILVAIGGPAGRRDVGSRRRGDCSRSWRCRCSPGAGGSSRSSRGATREGSRCWPGSSSAERPRRSSTGGSR
jgi:NADPH:quinone reductase-like Zn-dependent oxidoreductase